MYSILAMVIALGTAFVLQQNTAQMMVLKANQRSFSARQALSAIDVLDLKIKSFLSDPASCKAMLRAQVWTFDSVNLFEQGSGDPFYNLSFFDFRNIEASAANAFMGGNNGYADGHRIQTPRTFVLDGYTIVSAKILRSRRIAASYHYVADLEIKAQLRLAAGDPTPNPVRTLNYQVTYSYADYSAGSISYGQAQNFRVQPPQEVSHESAWAVGKCIAGVDAERVTTDSLQSVCYFNLTDKASECYQSLRTAARIQAKYTQCVAAAEKWDDKIGVDGKDEGAKPDEEPRDKEVKSAGVVVKVEESDPEGYKLKLSCGERHAKGPNDPLLASN
ncbi:MAG: hypothetical protein AB7P04_10910 [Bacteriovoracia bacterium]